MYQGCVLDYKRGCCDYVTSLNRPGLDQRSVTNIHEHPRSYTTISKTFPGPTLHSIIPPSPSPFTYITPISSYQTNLYQSKSFVCMFLHQLSTDSHWSLIYLSYYSYHYLLLNSFYWKNEDGFFLSISSSMILCLLLYHYHMSSFSTLLLGVIIYYHL